VDSFKLSQGCASDFTSEKHATFSGIGVNFPIPLFDVNREGQFHSSMLIPNSADLRNDKVIVMGRRLRNILAMNVDGSIIHETGKYSYTVQKNHLNKLINIFPSASLCTTTDNNRITMDSLGCSDGLVKGKSRPDSYFMSKKNSLVIGSFEVKDNNYAPIDCLRQSFAYATNFAFELVKAGVPAKDILIPLIGSNGHLMQFGCLRVLQPLFPYLICTSKVFDISDNVECDLAAAHFWKIDTFLESSGSYYESCYKGGEKVLQTDHGIFTNTLYHIKSMKEFYPIYGNDSREHSLRHFFFLMKEETIVYPLCDDM
jgi:hypothetical protein